MIKHKLLDEVEHILIENSYYEHKQKQLIILMKEFQCGGKYAHHLRLGDDIIIDGIKFLMQEYENRIKS